MNIAAITRFKHGDLLETLQRLNWTQGELAKRTGINANRISQFALLKYRPNPKDMERIQKAFGEVGVFFDVEKAWPEHFHGTKKSLKVIQTREVHPSRLIGLTPEVLQLPAPDPIATMEEREMIAKAIDNYIPSTAHKRHILRLHWLEGWSPNEIAAKLGKSPKYYDMVVRNENPRLRRWIFEEESGAHSERDRRRREVEGLMDAGRKLMHFPEPVEAQP